MRTAVLAGVVLLTAPGLAAANVPVVYRPGDAHYDRARLATAVAPVATLAALVVGAAWAVRSRGWKRAAAVGLVTLLLFVTAVFRLGSQTLVLEPGEEPPLRPVGGGFGPAPPAVSGVEVTLWAALAALLVAGVGIVAARWAERRDGRRDVPASP